MTGCDEVDFTASAWITDIKALVTRPRSLSGSAAHRSNGLAEVARRPELGVPRPAVMITGTNRYLAASKSSAPCLGFSPSAAR